MDTKREAEQVQWGILFSTSNPGWRLKFHLLKSATSKHPVLLRPEGWPGCPCGEAAMAHEGDLPVNLGVVKGLTIVTGE